MKRNNTLDLLKFIFSILIIMIHTSFLKTINTVLYNAITMGICRVAVPFFFISSGYYYYKKISLHKDTKSYIYRLMQLFITFEIIEIILYTMPLLSFIKRYGVMAYLWKIISVGVGGFYWYIVSLILSLFILTPLWKKKKILPMLILGLALYLMAMTNDSYSMFFKDTYVQATAIIHTKIWTWPQDGLCSSLLYLSIGALIYQIKPQIKHLNQLLVIFIILLIMESYFLQTHQANDANCYLSLMIVTPLIFIFVQDHSISLNTQILGKMSVYIYMIHPFVLNILKFTNPILLTNNELLFIITSIITIVLSYIICQGKQKRNSRSSQIN